MEESEEIERLFDWMLAEAYKDFGNGGNEGGLWIDFNPFSVINETDFRNLLADKDLYVVAMNTGLGPMDIHIVFDFEVNVAMSMKAARSA
jgi:hypothetical protein